MKILVTNDDGIFAPGIRSLANALASFGEVHVVAPTQEQSGTGHAITVHRPLRLSAVTAIPGVESCHMLDGTPADCVKMAIQGMGLTPDIVVSGINLGANLGTDVLYSGTVSAAIESVILGIPAIAVSLCGAHSMLSTAEEVVRKTFLEIKKRLPSDGLLKFCMTFRTICKGVINSFVAPITVFLHRTATVRAKRQILQYLLFAVRAAVKWSLRS